MAEKATWEQYLAANLVGYLLPASNVSRLDEEEARRFLRRLTARPDALDLLRSVSALAGHQERFSMFAGRLLPDLLRVLPSQNRVVVKRWEGGYHGRLDIRRTTAERLNGAASSFVTSARRRDHSLPENILVQAVVARLVSEVSNLHQAHLLSGAGWGKAYLAHEQELRRVLGFSRLSDVALEPIEGSHIRAANAARHPCYREAAWWWQRLAASRTKDPKMLAQLVAGSALTPTDEATRFELAVVVRLVESLRTRLREESGWRMELGLVLPDRDEVVRFSSPTGDVVRVIYNQCELPAGPADLGARHYLGGQGRLRPDVTVAVYKNGRRIRAHVFEVKLSEDPGYLRGGFHEAMLYAHEYADELTGWPQAALVSSSTVVGALSREHPVVAVDWARWVPDQMTDGLVEGLAV